jgi:hypothetical protein
MASGVPFHSQLCGSLIWFPQIAVCRRDEFVVLLFSLGIPGTAYQHDNHTIKQSIGKMPRAARAENGWHWTDPRSLPAVGGTPLAGGISAGFEKQEQAKPIAIHYRLLRLCASLQQHCSSHTSNFEFDFWILRKNNLWWFFHRHRWQDLANIPKKKGHLTSLVDDSHCCMLPTRWIEKK